MNVIRARVLGFCGGVRRAVTMVEGAAAQYGSVYTLNNIVNNDDVRDELHDKGVILVKRLSEIPDGAKVTLTAHGAPQQSGGHAEHRRHQS